MDLKTEFIHQYQSIENRPALPARIAGRYRLDRCLAQKADGGVWLMAGAEGGQYVLKTAHSGGQALEREYALMGQIPEALGCLTPMPVDYFEQEGMAYLVRTYLPGRPLSEMWRQDDPQCVEQCVSIGAQLCALLDRLHSMDPPVIHRDIKPENIILSPEGKPALIDFGIARNYRDGQGADTVFMGTRLTAAPEQYGYAQTDQRTDLYGLGVTLSWMLTGSYAPEALEQADCPEKLKRCLRRAAAFAPADRYSSAREMGRALSGSGRTKGWPAAVLAGCLTAAAAICLIVIGRGLGPGPAGAENSPIPAGFAESDSPVVEFESPLLEQAVRRELGIPQGDITRDDLQRVRRLAIVGRTLLSKDQSYEYRLTSYVDGAAVSGEGTISDLTPLADMSNLTELYLCGQQISDLSPLEGLPLEALYLCDNQIEDLAPLQSCTGLHTLFVGGNPLYDLSPLASLTGLRRLNLDQWDTPYAVDSLTPLTELPLEYLSVGNLVPSDGSWAALGRMDTVEELWLADPPKEAAAQLSEMAALRELSIYNFWAALELGAMELPALHTLSLYGGPETLEWLGKADGLEVLSLCGPGRFDLSPLAGPDSLTYLFLFSCEIADYSLLGRLSKLEEVSADPRTAAEVEAACPDRTFELRQ